MSYEKYKDLNWIKAPENLDNIPDIKGFDFSKKEFDFKQFLEAYGTTGFQASNLHQAMKVVEQMEKEECKIVLSFTGNAVSSGLREIIAGLIRDDKISAIVTSGAGIEEDIIKTMSTFKTGSFEVPGRMLLEKGIGRIGNIFVPVDRYTDLEKFLRPIFKEIHETQTRVSPIEFCKIVGEKLTDENSILYWAAKKNIPIFSPAIIDGSIGDLAYFFTQQKPDFGFDVLKDHKKIVELGLNTEKIGLIALGGGSSKHYALNGMIFREGFDYAVYLTTAQESDGSDSGGNPEEAITWAKIKTGGTYVKVKADFTITFPLLVAHWRF